MSLPTYAIYVDKDGNEVYKHFVNVGWSVSEFTWLEAVFKLPYNEYTHFIKLYNIWFPAKWINADGYPLLRQLYQERAAVLKARNNLNGYKDRVQYPYDHQTQYSEKILIPMIRRCMPSMIAADIVGVQPMTGSAGLVFSLRERYTMSRWERFVAYMKKIIKKVTT